MEFNKSWSWQRKRFSAKSIQHGAELKTARWPVADRLSFKPRSGIPPAEPVYLILYTLSFFFFFSTISALFFTSLWSPAPLSNPQSCWRDPVSGFGSSYCRSFPFDNRVKLCSARSLEKLTLERGRPRCLWPIVRSLVQMLRPLTAKAFEYKESCVHPTLPDSAPSPIRNRGKSEEFAYSVFHPTGPSHTHPSLNSVRVHVNFLRVSYNILRTPIISLGSPIISKREQTGMCHCSHSDFWRGVVRLTYILFKPCSWSPMLAIMKTWEGDSETDDRT